MRKSLVTALAPLERPWNVAPLAEGASVVPSQIVTGRSRPAPASHPHWRLSGAPTALFCLLLLFPLAFLADDLFDDLNDNDEPAAVSGLRVQRCRGPARVHHGGKFLPRVAAIVFVPRLSGLVVVCSQILPEPVERPRLDPVRPGVCRSPPFRLLP